MQNVTQVAGLIRQANPRCIGSGLYRSPYSVGTIAQQVRALQGYAREYGIKASLAACRVALDEDIRLRAARVRRQDRRDGRPTTWRLRGHLRDVCNAEINNRSLSRPTGWDGGTVTDRDVAGRLWVVHAEYRHEYTRNQSWWQGASYLCGYDDGQRFAMRIPRSITTVADAVAWATPAEVTRSQAAGYWTGRQGDIWLIERRRGADNIDALWRTRHDWDSEARTLTHPEHTPLTAPAHVRAVKAVQITQLSSSGRRNGD